MNGKDLWTKIINNLSVIPIEIETVPSNAREPLWFKVYKEAGEIYVDNAVVHKPATKMSNRRKIREDEFLAVYSCYHRWINGEKNLRQEAAKLSMNTAYIFAMVAHFE